MSPLLWQGVPFDDPDSWADFLGVHDQWNLMLAKEIQALTRKVLPFQVMDDLKEQGSVHQNFHDAVADALGIPRGGDIASANLKDKDEYTNWTYVHALDHERFRLVLGL